jgi:hydroxypyruvate isomerase
MPRFAANLGYLFTERPLLERIDAAATAGFKAIELQFPYDVPADAVKGAVERNRLTILGLNTPPGREGEFGLAAVSGRQKEWQAMFTPCTRLCKRDRRECDPLSRRQGCA